MKVSLISFVTALVLISPVAGAAGAQRNTTAASVASTTSSNSGGFHLGFSSDTTIVAGAASVPAISALFGLSDKLALQTYLGLSSTTPFAFGGGAMIKYTVVGDNSKGLHMGGGLGLGVTSAAELFYIGFGGNVGFHFSIVESVMIAVDGGVAVRVVTQGGGTSVQVGGNGSHLLGMSLLFRL